MQQHRHDTGMIEVVPTREALEKQILESLGLDAIRAILENQRALAVAISAPRGKKAAKLEIDKHPIELACEAMDERLRLIDERLGGSHA